MIQVHLMSEEEHNSIQWQRIQLQQDKSSSHALFVGDKVILS